MQPTRISVGGVQGTTAQKLTARFKAGLGGHSILATLYKAVKAYPITGSPLIDTLVLFATGMRESRFKSGTIKNPTSTALGYFQIIKGTRDGVTRQSGLKWDNSLLTQAKFAAFLYHTIWKEVQARRSKAALIVVQSPKGVRMSPAQHRFLNDLANMFWRYGGGWGKYAGHPHALSAASLLARYFPIFGAFFTDASRVVGDVEALPLNILFPTQQLRDEWDGAPLDVRDGVIQYAQTIGRDSDCHVTSIRSTWSGALRSEKNGPNHFHNRAIDISVTEPGTGMFHLDAKGRPRSPHFNWNKHMIRALKKENKLHPFPCAVGLETDHIHFDNARPPGIYTYSGVNPSYANDNPASLGLTVEQPILCKEG